MFLGHSQNSRREMKSLWWQLSKNHFVGITVACIYQVSRLTLPEFIPGYCVKAGLGNVGETTKSKLDFESLQQKNAIPSLQHPSKAKSPKQMNAHIHTTYEIAVERGVVMIKPVHLINALKRC